MSAPLAIDQRKTELRARPVQARSRKTFDAILVAAGELLSEVGWEGFNTNQLAERAGCRVATLYRYFPDKLAVVSTLAEQVVAQWGEELESFGVALQTEQDIRVVWRRYIRKFLKLLSTQPEALAVRKAMQAVPELRALDQADNARLAEALGTVLRSHFPTLSAKKAASAARLLIETVVIMIDLAVVAAEHEAKRLLAELETMHTAYFDTLYAART